MSKRLPPAIAGNRVLKRSNYRSNFPEQAHRLCLLGASARDLCEWFGCELGTLYEWRKRHPDFDEAVREGRRLADANVAASLYKRAVGYTAKEKRVEVSDDGTKEVDITKHIAPDVAAAKFWLTNRQPELWQDRKEVTVEHKTDVAKRILEARKRLNAQGGATFEVEDEDAAGATVDPLDALIDEGDDDDILE